MYKIHALPCFLTFLPRQQSYACTSFHKQHGFILRKHPLMAHSVLKRPLPGSAGSTLSVDIVKHGINQLILCCGPWFLLPDLWSDLSYQRRDSSGLWAGLNAETVLLFRADLLFSAEIPIAIHSSAQGEQYSETLGHGSEHEGFAKTCFCKELWLLRRNQKEVREAENALWGIGVGLDSSTGRNIKAQPSWGSWQFKDFNLSRVGGTWKRACVPRSGWPNADCHSICFVLFSILFPTAKIILVARHMTLAGKFRVSEEWRAGKSMKGEGGVSWRVTHPGPQWKGGVPLQAACKRSFSLLPLPSLRTQAHRFDIIKWKYILQLQLTQEMNNNVAIQRRGKCKIYFQDMCVNQLKLWMCDRYTTLKGDCQSEPGEIRDKGPIVN